MSKRLFGTFHTVFADDSLLSFEAYSPRGGLPSRILRIGEQRVVDMGNYCNTCALLFKHLADPAQRVRLDALTDKLADGVTKRDIFKVLDLIYPVLPQGAYEVSLLELSPRLIRRGSPQDYFVADQPLLWIPQSDEPENPGTDYYREATRHLDSESALFEFVVPLLDQARLNAEVVAEYERSMAAGRKPTALAISILDWRQPATWQPDPPVTQHYLLANYLIDGHHKMLAAANTGRPLTVLSFLARDHSMATLGDVARVFGYLDNDR